MEEDITNSDIKSAIRRSVLAQTFTPVVAGSALKNKVTRAGARVQLVKISLLYLNAQTWSLVVIAYRQFAN